MEEDDGENDLKDAIWKRGGAETKSGETATSFWGSKALPWPLSQRDTDCDSERERRNGTMEKERD